MPQPRNTEQAFSLGDAAARLGWARQTLVRALKRHGGYGQKLVGTALIAPFLALVASASHAETDDDTVVRSTAKPRFQVVDGDTVKFGPQLVGLFGIDAPEKGQTCDDGQWHPGPLATKVLVAFIAGRPVSCHQVDYDRKNNRPVAVCFAGKDDLQALMVSAGWAWAYTAFSDQYSDAERRAAARGVGVHAHRCQPPWEWRALKRSGQ